MRTQLAIKVTLAIVSTLFAFALPAFAESAPSLTEGLYDVVGSHSTHGAYTGRVQVTSGRVQRLIEWSSYQHKGLAIQSIWDGALAQGEPRFELKMSTVLTSFENFSPSRAELNAAIPVTGRFENGTWIFEVPNEGAYRETWTFVRPPGEPLWKNERTMSEGVGKKIPFTVQVARILGINKVIDWYRNHPETAPYRDRPEYKSQKQIFIRDTSDSRFYAQNRNTLRLVNRTLNPLAFAESMMRRNAYGPTLREKAEFFLAEMLKYNLNEEGLLEIGLVNLEQKRIGREPEYDAALWSAMFAWSEALRYQSTKDPGALENFRKVLRGMLTLVEITNDPKTFARTVAISPVSENLGDGWNQGTGAFSHLKWRSGGNNDMLKSLLVTLALAHQLPQDPAMQSRIRNIAERLTQLEVAKDGDRNEALANGLAAMWTKDPRFLKNYYSRNAGLKSTLASAFNVGAGFYYGGIADWSGVQLTMVSTISEILVAKELGTEFSDSDNITKLRNVQVKSEELLFEMQKTYKPAKRDFLTLMTYAYSPAARKTKGFVEEAQEALWTLKEIPTPRVVGAGTVDLRMWDHWSLSAWPRLPWKALDGVFKMKSNLEYRGFASGVYSYPHFETNAWNSVYLWKDSPFSLHFASDPSRRLFSSDYLLVYWAAQTAGLAL